jgi:hypothetical protein
MANTVISLRSSGVSSNTPSLGVLANGELSLNFADGILYYKTAANALGSIRTTQVTGLNKEIQFNDSGSFGSNASLTFDKATTTLTTNNFVANTITTGTGAGGIIAGANVIYSNVFVANSGGYIQFSDGSKQYTANAGSGGGNVTSVAGATGVVSNTNILTGLLTVDGTGSGLDADLLDGLNSTSFANATFAQAAFDKANTDTTNVTVTDGTYGNATYTPIVTVAANGRITNISTIETSGGGGGGGTANVGDYFPTNNDWGYYDDAIYSAFGESLLTLYDCRIDPITPSGYLLTKDFGFLT